jgi:hypothetical protein
LCTMMRPMFDTEFYFIIHHFGLACEWFGVLVTFLYEMFQMDVTELSLPYYAHPLEVFLGVTLPQSCTQPELNPGHPLVAGHLPMTNVCGSAELRSDVAAAEAGSAPTVHTPEISVGAKISLKQAYLPLTSHE